jgi:hypothetical protein
MNLPGSPSSISHGEHTALGHEGIACRGVHPRDRRRPCSNSSIGASALFWNSDVAQSFGIIRFPPFMLLVKRHYIDDCWSFLPQWER